MKRGRPGPCRHTLPVPAAERLAERLGHGQITVGNGLPLLSKRVAARGLTGNRPRGAVPSSERPIYQPPLSGAASQRANASSRRTRNWRRCGWPPTGSPSWAAPSAAPEDERIATRAVIASPAPSSQACFERVCSRRSKPAGGRSPACPASSGSPARRSNGSAASSSPCPRRAEGGPMPVLVEEEEA